MGVKWLHRWLREKPDQATPVIAAATILGILFAIYIVGWVAYEWVYANGPAEPAGGQAAAKG